MDELLPLVLQLTNAESVSVELIGLSTLFVLTVYGLWGNRRFSLFKNCGTNRSPIAGYDKIHIGRIELD